MKSLEKDEKIISYLKEVYKEKNGEEIPIPPNKELNTHLLSSSNSDVEKNRIPNQKFFSFKDKINLLNLPDVNDKEAKTLIEKLWRLKETKILINKIDLSYFEKKNIRIYEKSYWWNENFKINCIY